MSRINSKISTYLLLLAISTVSSYAFFEYFTIKQNSYTELELNANYQISRLVENLDLPLWEMDTYWINAIISTEMLNNNLQGIVVKGANSLFVAQKRGKEWQATPATKDIELTGKIILKQQDIMHAGEQIGQIKLYLTPKFIEEKLQKQLFKTILGMATLGTSIIILMVLLLRYIVINPLNNLVLATKKIAQGQYDIQLNIDKKDEIGRLANGFNTMRDNIKLRENERDSAISALNQSKKDLITSNASLEQHVLERTEALEKSNQHLKELSAEFKRSKNEAELANNTKSIFLANMSHELRTPMNAVLGFSRLMRDDANTTSAQKENLDIINRSGNHLLNLINDVLDMAKIESGRVNLENAPFDLGLLVRDLMDMMHERAETKGLTLALDQSSSFPRFINSDSTKIKQILVNLVSNAIKCTDEGHVSLRLNTTPNNDNADLCLHFEIEDTGRGISEEDLPLIFNAFTQAGDQSSQNGTGLGLAISHQYIDLLQGTISVKSELGKGSLFQVAFPVQRVNEKTILNISSTSSSHIIGIKSTPKQKKYRILVIEDQFENRLLLQRLLESVGYEVQVAVNGQEGVEKFIHWKPDFIWMDRRMPVMGGIEATQQIRKLPGGDKVKIVAVTASVFDQERKVLLGAGTNDIVNKPYSNDEIFSCMAKYLDVEYIYADESNTQDKSQSADISQQQLSNLPEQLLTDLREAAISLDVEQSIAIIEQITPIDEPLATKLQQLVENFEFETLLKSIAR